MSAIEIARQDLSISELRAEAARTADAKQARRILALPWCWMVIRGCWLRRPVPWTGRRYATGCIATTRMAWPGCGPAPAWRQLVWPKPSERSGKWVEDGPDLKTDAWCAGAVLTCVTALRQIQWVCVTFRAGTALEP